MRLLIIALLCSLCSQAQQDIARLTVIPSQLSLTPLPAIEPATQTMDIRLKPYKWKMDRNHWITGALVFTAGASKGFNETLTFHWKAFKRTFPNANPNWFNPNVSWRNKYKHGDPNAGAKFPLSTSVLVMFTDQYHLNNFVNKLAWTSTIVIKIGEGKKPLKHYIWDALYYTACHQAGFALTYYPFKGMHGQ